MMLHKSRLGPLLLAFALLGLALAAPLPVAHAATFVIINNDGAGEGFNDPTPVAPVGGNTGTTIGAQRLIAFQYAANIWGGLLSSSVTIRVAATFDPLTCNSTSAVLGSAGPTTSYRDFTGAPVAGTWYSVAEANALHGSDLDPGDDISAQFNSSLGTTCAFPNGWYYGLDGNPGSNIDFVSVLVHELGHGLGFLTLVDLSTGAKALGFNDTFMRFLENHGAIPADYPSMTNAQRLAASTSTGNLHWVGPNVRAASSVLTAGTVGDHVRMFAPNPQQPGSSVSHWDTVLTPDQVMEPVYTGVHHNPVLELPLFQDIGWTLSAPPPGSIAVTPATDIVAGGPQGGPFSPSSFNYTLTATSGTRNYSISGVPSWLTASSTSGSATTSGTPVTFTVNASANSLAIGTYPVTITFTDTTSNTTALTINATLTVDSVATLQVTPPSNMATVGNPGGPFSPASFQYQLSTNNGSANYSITGLPAWLNVSSASGTATTTPTTITFTVNSAANSLAIDGYNATISFSNTTNGNGNQTRNAALTVNSGGTAPLAMRTWVSGTGSDSNDCTLTAPCLTFAGALARTAAAGEINALGSGGFGGVTINKSITISSEGFNAGVLVSGTDGIVVNVSPTDIVVLRGLDIEGLGTGTHGINFIGSGSLYVEKSIIHHFTGNGINFVPNTGAASLFVNDVYSRNNGSNGILVQPSSAASANVSVRRSQLFDNTAAGFRADGTGSSGGILAAIADTVSSGNAGAGYTSFSQSGNAATKTMIFHSVSSNNATGLNANGASAIMRVGLSVVSRNSTGVSITNGAAASTYSNNQIDDNVSAGSALAPIPPH